MDDKKIEITLKEFIKILEKSSKTSYLEEESKYLLREMLFLAKRIDRLEDIIEDSELM